MTPSVVGLRPGRGLRSQFPGREETPKTSSVAYRLSREVPFVLGHRRPFLFRRRPSVVGGGGQRLSRYGNQLRFAAHQHFTMECVAADAQVLIDASAR
jgi:hypothetical protein